MKGKESGLTLIEVLFVIVIMSIVMTAAFLTFRGSFSAWQAGNRRSELVQIARVGLDKIIREVRQAQGFNNPCNSTTLSYTDKDGTSRRFQIVTGTNNLKFGTVGGGPLSILVNPIESGSSFTYYENDGVTETTTPSDINSVLVTLEVSDSEGKVGDITVTSRAKQRREPLSVGLIYVAGSRKDTAGNTTMEFDIRNSSGGSITVTSLTAVYSGGYTYTSITWGGPAVWAGVNYSGDVATFISGQTIDSGNTETIKLKGFSGDISTVTFEVTFSDGSVVDVPLEGG